MADRWKLSRAGIVNVYQYADETLHFADGRLLLRGVNGSGKSTAMNMLLPFLLDADTRRIDAAGEQAGVLKSWMLAGRDDPQPVGYLWIELARGEDHVTCGCGIKANRAADTVTTWWFVTSRRPGVDLDLVEARHPLGAEALRATLGSDPVFRHDQRGAYRAEVRARLFGGAEIDQHVRLLHVVRNPRVGDRIDQELPGYLVEALPQLSDAALDDAAQPLDDLEEHRRNVEDLARTGTALEAVHAVYTSYARGELRRRAAAARELTGAAAGADRALAQAVQRAGEATAVLAEARAVVEGLEDDERRFRRELDGLRDSPVYRDASELNDLRGHVTSLARAIAQADEQVGRQAAATARSRQALADAARAAGDDREGLVGDLRDLASCLVPAGLPVGPPDAPALDVETVEEVAPVDPAPTHRALEGVRGAAVHRRGDVAEVRDVLRAVDDAERHLARAVEAWQAAVDEVSAAQQAADDTRAALDRTVGEWRGALHEWASRLDAHRTAAGLDGTAMTADLGADLVARRDEVSAALAGVADATVEAHLGARASLAARREAEQAMVDELAAVVAALDGRALPPVPAAPWQRDDRGVVLAELVDFDESMDAGARAGLEAAMEAAGLLGAEVTADGELRLAEGGLAVRAGDPVPDPLGRLLTVVIPEEHADRLDAAAIARVLDSISTDGAAIDGGGGGGGGGSGGGATTVVTVDGRFRLGVLRGRHAKPEAEHVGVTARRAALERQRADARRRWDAARSMLDGTDRELAATDLRVTDARALRAALPAVTPVLKASIAADDAEERVARAGEIEDARRQAHRLADEAYAEAVEKSRRTATNLRLPTDAEGLRRVEDALDEAVRLARRSDDRLVALVRSVGQWQAAGDAWRAAGADERHAKAAQADAAAAHAPVAARLATLEDTIGAAYEQIVGAVTTCEADLERTTGELAGARQAQLERQGMLAAAEQHVDEQERREREAADRAVAVLPGLRRALLVPGLLESAVATDDGDEPTESPVGPAEVRLAPVEQTPDGVRALAVAIEAHVPAPERADVGAESVRQSLRQRRDALGSGWDAEDRQADESLPLSVEVNGPQGRMPLAQATAVVGARRRELGSLLSREQDDALRNLLQGLVAREVAEKLHAASELVTLMNRRLATVTTTHGIGVSLRWRRRDDLDAGLGEVVDLLAKPPDLRTAEQEETLRAALSARLAEARLDDPEAPYRDLIGRVLDYRSWHELRVVLRRPGRSDERLTRRTALSEGEKKIVSYLPLFAAVAASCDSLAESAPGAPRFVLLDDAFAKVSEDNHPKLFGLLVELDLDFIATSERLWGTHATVPALAITEVVRDADLGVIVLEHSHWDGTARADGSAAGQP
jgi:uncharacterized protein (TIGR02680 family)